MGYRFRARSRRVWLATLLATCLVAASALVARAADPDSSLLTQNRPWICNIFPWLPQCSWPAPWLSVATRSGAVVTYGSIQTNETEKGVEVQTRVRILNGSKAPLDPGAIRFQLSQIGTNVSIPGTVEIKVWPPGSLPRRTDQPGQGKEEPVKPPVLAPGEEAEGVVTFLIPVEQLQKGPTRWTLVADGQPTLAMTIGIECEIRYPPLEIRCKITIDFAN